MIRAAPPPSRLAALPGRRLHVAFVSALFAVLALSGRAEAQDNLFFGLKSGGFELARTDLDGANLATIYVPGASGYAKLVAVDSAGGRLYFFDPDQGAIMTAALDGSGLATVKSVANLTDLAFHGGKLYYAKKCDAYDLRRCDADGSNEEVIYSPVDAVYGYVKAVAIDAAAGRVYFFDPREETVSRANLDGSGAEAFPLTVKNLFDMAVHEGHLYYCLQDTDFDLRRMDLGDPGVDERVIDPSGYAKRVAIDWKQQRLYLADPAPGTGPVVLRANLDGSSLVPILFFDIYDIAVHIEATPEIAVAGSGLEIQRGDASPSAADGTDFLTADLDAGAVVRTFTISNAGSADVILSGAPRVAVSGDDFTLTSDATTPLVPGAMTTFQVTFDPSVMGLCTGAISIANNDSDENPYVFSIQGTGVRVPEMVVEGLGVPIVDGDSTPAATDGTEFGNVEYLWGSATRTFTISNLGAGPLNLTDSPRVTVSAGDFTLTTDATTPVAPVGGTTTFNVTFRPTSTGLATATVSIANDDIDENPYNFTIQGTGVAAPEIQVEGNARVINNADSTPDVADDTDFGSADIGTGSVTHTFTVRNNGSDALYLTDSDPRVVVTGSAFLLTTDGPATAIAANGGTATFQITFDPVVTGPATGTVSVANNDSNENPYTFVIAGNGTVAPEMVVEGLAVEISDGDTLSSPDDDTHFGTINVGGESETHTFTIRNAGSDVLNLTDSPRVTVSAGDFTLTTDATTPLAPGATTTFQVTLDPSAAGLRIATVSIASDDPDENPYDFAIAGTGVTIPEMLVEGNSLEIVSGDVSPSVLDDTDFGAASVTGDTVTRTFTVRNTGSRDLLLTGTPRVALSAGDFALTSDIASPTLVPGASETFEVVFDPSATGLRAATVSIRNNDGDENPYTFDIWGTGTGLPAEEEDDGCAAGTNGGGAGPWLLSGLCFLAFVALRKRRADRGSCSTQA